MSNQVANSPSRVLIDWPHHAIQDTEYVGKNLGYSITRLSSGKSAGVDIVQLVAGDLKLVVIPTRGLGFLEAWRGNQRFGWDSPIRGPVHPSLVPLADPTGLGWLEGFDEMMARCGLRSNGAPEFDEQGRLQYGLHGQIANIPAHHCQVDLNEEEESITLSGSVDETRFHFQKWRLETSVTIRANNSAIEIRDRVLNLSGKTDSFQLLYHFNFGPPLLSRDAEIYVNGEDPVPRDDAARGGLANWNRMPSPDAEALEQVFFIEPNGPEGRAFLTDANHQLGVGVAFDTAQLPCFSLWKNAVDPRDGYVVGLEPATNYPNPRSQEEAAGRVVNLGPEEAAQFRLNLELCINQDEVENQLRHF